MKEYEFHDFAENSRITGPPGPPPNPYPNSNPRPSHRPKKQQVQCRDWAARGVCERGRSCKFLHSNSNLNESVVLREVRELFTGISVASSARVDDVEQAQVQQVVHKKKILFLKKKDRRGESDAESTLPSSSSGTPSRDTPRSYRDSPSRDTPRSYRDSPSRGFPRFSGDTPSRDSPRSYRDTPSRGFPRSSGDTLSRDSPSRGRENSRREKKEIFSPHLGRVDLLKGIADKIYSEGILRINKMNRYDGYVRFEGLDDVFIPGIRNQNRALDGDVVCVRLLEGPELEKEMKLESEKKAIKAKQNQERQAKVNFFEEAEEDVVFEEKRIYGTIVGILESNTRSQNHVGVLSLSKPNHSLTSSTSTSDEEPSVGRFIWFWPNDKRVPYILIPSQLVPSEILNARDEFPSTLYTSKITGWNDSSLYPIGTFTGKLGQMGELPTESEALLVAAGITWEDFSEEVLESLVKTPWSIPESEIAKRADLRNERIFSIDPPTARDLDDAVSIKDLGNGTFELGVHIADVSYFVTPGTALDSEAYHRATSVYLVQKVIPMIPRLLCEELCSLNAGVDRLAFSVFWIVDEDANFVGEPRFTRSVINSCAKLWYDHAQAVIEDRDWNDVNPVSLAGGWTPAQVHKDIKLLFSLSQKLRLKRYEAGALTLYSIKLWFKLDDVGNPIESGVYEQKEANRLIEEFMLLANMAVAKKISSAYPEAALLRRHPPPLEKALENVTEILRKEGIILDVGSAGGLHASLEAIEDPTKRMLARLLLIKGMKRADYFCTGSVDISTFSHYELHVPLYTHFTSPIRRYCDLVVHRLLDAALNDQEMPFSKHLIDGTSSQCNVRKFASKDAQDASQHLFLCAFLYDIQRNDSPEGIVVDAYVNNVGSRSFDVVVPRFGIETRVWLEDSLNQGKIAGLESDLENLKLKVHWKKFPDGDDDEKIVEQEEGPEVEKTTGLDLKKHNTQIIGMFDNIKVLIQTDIKRSPPSFKLYAVQPEIQE